MPARKTGTLTSRRKHRSQLIQSLAHHGRETVKYPLLSAEEQTRFVPSWELPRVSRQQRLLKGLFSRKIKLRDNWATQTHVDKRGLRNSLPKQVQTPAMAKGLGNHQRPASKGVRKFLRKELAKARKK